MFVSERQDRDLVWERDPCRQRGMMILLAEEVNFQAEVPLKPPDGMVGILQRVQVYCLCWMVVQLLFVGDERKCISVRKRASNETETLLYEFQSYLYYYTVHGELLLVFDDVFDSSIQEKIIIRKVNS